MVPSFSHVWLQKAIFKIIFLVTVFMYVLTIHPVTYSYISLIYSFMFVNKPLSQLQCRALCSHWILSFLKTKIASITMCQLSNPVQSLE